MSHQFFAPRAASILAAAAVAATGWLAPAAMAAPAETAFALSAGNLLTFDPATPSSTTTKAITGVTAGETLVGIDVRPQNGMLYGLGVNATADTATLYAIGRTTGFAGIVGTASGIAFTTDGTTAVDLPAGEYGFDFNPAVDRLRVTAGSLNFRVNPNTGGAIDGDNTGVTPPAPAVAGTNPDGAINGAATTVSGSAYTNDRPNNGGITTLYALNTTTDALTIQSPANAGTQTASTPITVGGSPIDFTAVGGFDIDPAVSTAASNTPVASGQGFATLAIAGTTRLYRIDLTNGVAIAVGTVGTGTASIEGLALQRDFDDAGFPAVALNAAATSLVRFSTATPGTTTTVTLPSVGSATFVGVSWRPQTGQLFGLAVDAAADTATIYLIDPQTAAVTAVGAVGSIAWVAADGTTPVNLPAASAGWAIDFNPTVDRVRIVANGGLNTRANPNTGAPVDGDQGGAASSVAGVNTDGAHNPLPAGSTGVTATSYTNAFTQSLPGSATTQYVLEPSSNQLFIQNPPNAGGLTLPQPVTLGGVPLDFAANASLDIPGDVSVTTSATAATGTGIARLTVAGIDGLYALNLNTGAASLLGTTAAALGAVAVGDAQRDTPVTPTPTPTPTPAATPAPTPTPTPKPIVLPKPVIGVVSLTARAKLTRKTSAKVKGSVLDTGYTLSCPTAFNGPCEVKIKVTIKKPGKLTLATKTIKVQPGRSAKLKVTLTKAGRASLRRNGPLRATVAITGEVSTSAATTTTRRTSTIKG